MNKKISYRKEYIPNKSILFVTSNNGAHHWRLKKGERLQPKKKKKGQRFKKKKAKLLSYQI